MQKYKPIVLIILDGWGISPSWGGNAIAVNPPEHINRLWRDYPHKILQAFTLVAGKYGIVGDSRLGHSTIAAGRRIPQDLEIISESIANSSFYKNKVLLEAIEHCKTFKSNLHLLGLVSNGGVHSHIKHLNALLELCYRTNFDRVFIDAITDGIDSGENDALSFIEEIKTKILEIGVGKFSSVVGRLYAMDRIGDFRKTLQSYKMLTEGKGSTVDTISRGISEAYRDGLNDFNVKPTLIKNNDKITTIKDNDAVIFFNFRSDRSEQLTRMFVGQSPKKLFWHPKTIKNLYFATMTEYEKSLSSKVAYKKQQIHEILGDILSKHQLRQLRVAESEKGAHVTNFFNCGNENPSPLEDWRIIASKRVNDQTKNPEMKTPKLARIVSSAIESKKYDFILLNLANVDMISHTGNIITAGVAIKAVDKAVSEIVEANLKIGGATIITADHGNIEQMVKLKPEQDPETKHTLNPVPFILITKDNKKNLIQGAISSDYNTLSKLITAKETLADIAPTVLEIMNLPKPEAMTGHSLLNKLE